MADLALSRDMRVLNGRTQIYLRRSSVTAVAWTFPSFHGQCSRINCGLQTSKLEVLSMFRHTLQLSHLRVP